MGSFCPLPYSHAHNLFLSMWKRALVPRRRITRVELAIWPSLSGRRGERGNSCVETSGVAAVLILCVDRSNFCIMDEKE